MAARHCQELADDLKLLEQCCKTPIEVEELAKDALRNVIAFMNVSHTDAIQGHAHGSNADVDEEKFAKRNESWLRLRNAVAYVIIRAAKENVSQTPLFLDQLLELEVTGQNAEAIDKVRVANHDRLRSILNTSSNPQVLRYAATCPSCELINFICSRKCT